MAGVAPERTPTPEERRLASVALEAFRPAQHGVGFCRFDYRRDLTAVGGDVPSEPGGPSVGRVERWW